MEPQDIIIKVQEGRMTVQKIVQIPTDEELVAAALELRRLGGNDHPAGGQYGPCVAIYIPPRGYSSTSIDVFTGEIGETREGGTIPASCAFWYGSEDRIADTLYEHGPPQIHYYRKKAQHVQANLFDERPKPLQDGAARVVERTEYERDPRLRELCLKEHGTRCAVCRIDFGATYGDCAKGFIHVHHLTPLSHTQSAHLVNPRNDLIPVCPNCHAVIHLKDPPYTPDEVRHMVGKATQASAFTAT